MNEIRKNTELEEDIVSMSFKMEPALYVICGIQILLGATVLTGGILLFFLAQDGKVPGIIVSIIGLLLFVGYVLSMIFRMLGMKRSEVKVSNRRIYGRYGLYIKKRDFSYRLDEIDNVELASFLGAKQLVINFQDGKGPKGSVQVVYNNMPAGMLGAGVLKFQSVKNYQEVYDKLCELLLSVKSNVDVDIDIKMKGIEVESRKADAMEDIARGMAGGAIAKETTSNVSYIEEIKKLKELLDSGAITQEEFEKEKKEILDSNH